MAEWVQSISVPLFDEAMRGMSALGWWLGAAMITAGAAAVLVAVKHRGDAALLVVLVAVSSGVNWTIKQIVARPRPDPALLEVREDLAGYGFPSGHVMFALACFGALALSLSGVGGRYVRVRKVGQAALVLLIAAMVMSRVYMGAHWPSDALGAAVTGGVLLAAMAGCRGRLRGRGGVIESRQPA